MRVVMVVFDTLSRRLLPPYGCDWVVAPNFVRLAENSVVFDNCYAGSMACIPARRELHTGRLNFLHRAWGPLEPFDDSVPELLDKAHVHTHLVTDHSHYWEDGGATYHSRFSTFEFFRGQEGDKWVPDIATLRSTINPAEEEFARRREPRALQDRVNRQVMQSAIGQSQTRVFDAGLSFLSRNHNEDRWLLQIETFDPHEPYFAPSEFRQLYPAVAGEEDGTDDWPIYRPVRESPSRVQEMRYRHAGLLSMCDRSLGRVLDAFDEFELWGDTMLVVWTDHGFLLGEHGWWGKTLPPWYDEIIHTPLFIWDPSTGARDQRRSSLVQTIDIGPTLLDVFDLEPTTDMQGVSLRETLATDQPVREAGLFGIFGGHVSVTDRRYVYMRAPVSVANTPLFEYTLMPTRMRERFKPEELRTLKLEPPFSFTKGASVLRVSGRRIANPYFFGTRLYDMEADPGQQSPLIDDAIEIRMIELLVRLLHDADAPAEQFKRLGLPEAGDVGPEHLLAREQHSLVVASTLPPFGAEGIETSIGAPICDLLQTPQTAEIVLRHLPGIDEPGLESARALSILQLALLSGGSIPTGTTDGVTPAVFEALSRDLGSLRQAVDDDE